MAERHGPRHHEDDRKHDPSIKIEVNHFDGLSHDPETYLDWEKSLERFFDFKDTLKIKSSRLQRLNLPSGLKLGYMGFEINEIEMEKKRFNIRRN